MQRTYKFIIFSLLLLISVLSASAQVKTVPKDTVFTPLYNGIRLDVDISPVFKTLLSGNETFSYEAAILVNLKRKYFPVIEMGYAGADKITENNIGFKTNGIFGRAGIDFNLMKSKTNKKNANNLFFVGARLGFANFKYDLTNVVITDDYWKENLTMNYRDESSSKMWFEIVAGMRVEIVKNIFMGWTVRNKNLIGEDQIGTMSPWYIPGFGKTTGSAWTVNYSIGYKF